MAYGVTLSASMAYADSEGSEVSRALSDLTAAIATKRYNYIKQNIGTSEEAILLGDVSAPGWALFINLDPTNFVELRVGTGGAKFAKLKPGEFALLRLGSGAQVPYAIADTAAIQLEVFIAST